MRTFLASLILATVAMISCGAGEPVEEAAPVVATQPEAAPVTLDLVTSDPAPAAEAPVSEAPAGEGLVDKVTGILSSVDALIGAIIGILLALGVSVPWIKKTVARLKKAREAIKVVVGTIEEHKKPGAPGQARSIGEKVAEKAPKGTEVGAIIHEAVEEVAKENGG